MLEVESKGSLLRDKVNKYGFINFVKHENSLLNVTAALSGYVRRPGECALICADLSNGFSFNYADNADVHGRHACDILSTDKYNDSAMFKTNKKGFTHYSIKVSRFVVRSFFVTVLAIMPKKSLFTGVFRFHYKTFLDAILIN